MGDSELYFHVDRQRDDDDEGNQLVSWKNVALGSLVLASSSLLLLWLSSNDERVPSSSVASTTLRPSTAAKRKPAESPLRAQPRRVPTAPAAAPASPQAPPAGDQDAPQLAVETYEDAPDLD